MKKFVAAVVLLCAVMISSTTSAVTMANWVFIKDFTITVPYVPKYTQTPQQYFYNQYLIEVGKGASAREARRRAEYATQQYEAAWEAEQDKLNTSSTYKLWSSYIDTNSVVAEQTADGSVAFCVLVKNVYTSDGIKYISEGLRKNKENVPAEFEKLSFIVGKVHFKSPDGITKYWATSDRIGFKMDGTQIRELTLSNAPLNWEFIQPRDYLDAIFDAAYKLLR